MRIIQKWIVLSVSILTIIDMQAVQAQTKGTGKNNANQRTTEIPHYLVQGPIKIANIYETTLKSIVE